MDGNKSSFSYKFLFFLLWNCHTITMFIFMVIHRTPLSVIEEFIAYALYAITSVFAAKFIIKKIKPLHLLLFFILVCVYICSMMDATNSSIYLFENIGTILLGSIPVMFVGVAFDDDDENLVRWIHITSQISIVLMVPFSFLYFAISTSRDVDDMALAYSVLPHYCFLLSCFIKIRSKLDLVLALVGFFLLTTYGTRGTILLATLYLLLSVSIELITNKKKRLVIFVVCSSILYVIVNKWEDMLYSISSMFGLWGLNSRIFDRLITLEFFQSEGRSDIIDSVVRKISQKPYFGFGMAGDRDVLGGDSYAHNFYYEILCSYGYIFGGLIFVALAWLFLTAFKRAWNTNYYIVYMPLVFSGFLKLFLSSSYLIEPFFFLLIGVSLKICQKYK